MKKINISELVKAQRDFFDGGHTLSLDFRIFSLEILYREIKERETEIFEALRADLGKSDFESFMCEIGMTLSEITYMLKNLKKFARPTRVKTPLSQFPSRSYTLPTPYGNTLIMSPWNYPFLLTLSPLVNAIAAGNTAIIKPSAYSPRTSELIADIIEKCYPSEYVAVVTGGRRENEGLLSEKFDFIFFTGSQAVGKEVLRHSAENLTPAVLELGGKSPCIVDKSADIQLSAKRIVFGKYLNCGQTCVAPDYILCDSTVKDSLISAIKSEIALQFGEDALSNPDYGRIVNEKHFDRLLSLIDEEKLIYGGKSDRDTLKIEPTVMDNVTEDDAVMGEEIFGPILPILTYSEFSDVFEFLREKQKPLALYLFTEDKKHIKAVTHRVRYGGGCINDVIIHLATSEMGFGGVGESGMGAYHGRCGFEAFSHRKSILNKSTRIDLKVRYQPYNRKKNFKLLKKLMK